MLVAGRPYDLMTENDFMVEYAAKINVRKIMKGHLQPGCLWICRQKGGAFETSTFPDCHWQQSYEKNLYDIPLYWLVNRDFIMADYNPHITG